MWRTKRTFGGLLSLFKSFRGLSYVFNIFVFYSHKLICRIISHVSLYQILPRRSIHQILISTLHYQSDAPHNIFFLLTPPQFLPDRRMATLLKPSISSSSSFSSSDPDTSSLKDATAIKSLFCVSETKRGFSLSSLTFNRF